MKARALIDGAPFGPDTAKAMARRSIRHGHGSGEVRTPIGIARSLPRRMMSERPPIPTEEREPAWRLACLAYRAMRREGADQEAHEAAPPPCNLCCRYCGNGVAYATKYHSDWFWRGAQHAQKRRD